MAYNELFSLGGNGIIDILTDDANATASQILSGYTAYVKVKRLLEIFKVRAHKPLLLAQVIKQLHLVSIYLVLKLSKEMRILLPGILRKELLFLEYLVHLQVMQMLLRQISYPVKLHM